MILSSYSVSIKVNRTAVARSIDNRALHKLIFFVFDGIILRSQHSRLCEILEKKGLIRNSDVQKTLEKQQSLKSRRVGEIISEQNKISINDVEAVLQRSYKSVTVPPNTRVGDILIAEGLVTGQQVDEALASQQSGRKRRSVSCLLSADLYQRISSFRPFLQNFVCGL